MHQTNQLNKILRINPIIYNIQEPVRQQANIENGGLKEIKMYYRITGYYPEKKRFFHRRQQRQI